MSERRYRVIQWSTGNVGTFALRAVLGHPALDLAGVWVHDEKKAGRDAGELCGAPPVGVVATPDADALLASDADCVVYTATADLRLAEVYVELGRKDEARLMAAKLKSRGYRSDAVEQLMKRIAAPPTQAQSRE